MISNLCGIQNYDDLSIQFTNSTIDLKNFAPPIKYPIMMKNNFYKSKYIPSQCRGSNGGGNKYEQYETNRGSDDLKESVASYLNKGGMVERRIDEYKKFCPRGKKSPDLETRFFQKKYTSYKVVKVKQATTTSVVGCSEESGKESDSDSSHSLMKERIKSSCDVKMARVCGSDDVAVSKSDPPVPSHLTTFKKSHSGSNSSSNDSFDTAVRMMRDIITHEGDVPALGKYRDDAHDGDVLALVKYRNDANNGVVHQDPICTIADASSEFENRESLTSFRRIPPDGVRKFELSDNLGLKLGQVDDSTSYEGIRCAKVAMFPTELAPPTNHDSYCSSMLRNSKTDPDGMAEIGFGVMAPKKRFTTIQDLKKKREHKNDACHATPLLPTLDKLSFRRTRSWHCLAPPPPPPLLVTTTRPISHEIDDGSKREGSKIELVGRIPLNPATQVIKNDGSMCGRKVVNEELYDFTYMQQRSSSRWNSCRFLSTSNLSLNRWSDRSSYIPFRDQEYWVRD